MPFTPALVADGLVFPEAPRWHAGRLWCSDMYGGEIVVIGPGREDRRISTVPHRPGGLGWTPSGTLLLVSMVERKLLRRSRGGWCEVAELGSLASFHCNDMLVDALGRAYIGNFGFDIENGGSYRPAELILVPPNGPPRVVADGMAFPNGMAQTPDGRTLIVAESEGARLTAFDIHPDGSLGRRRLWAHVPSTRPDGSPWTLKAQSGWRARSTACCACARAVR